jgi:hypothetical protein
MDDVYSLTLLIALVCSAAGALSGAISVFKSKAVFRLIAIWAGVFGVFFGVVSFGVHLRFGHGPESPEPIALGLFLRVHPAYGVVLLLCLVALFLGFLSRSRH